MFTQSATTNLKPREELLMKMDTEIGSVGLLYIFQIEENAA